VKAAPAPAAAGGGGGAVVLAPRESAQLERIADALEALVSLGRRAAATMDWAADNEVDEDDDDE